MPARKKRSRKAPRVTSKTIASLSPQEKESLGHLAPKARTSGSSTTITGPSSILAAAFGRDRALHDFGRFKRLGILVDTGEKDGRAKIFEFHATPSGRHSVPARSTKRQTKRARLAAGLRTKKVAREEHPAPTTGTIADHLTALQDAMSVVDREQDWFRSQGLTAKREKDGTIVLKRA